MRYTFISAGNLASLTGFFIVSHEPLFIVKDISVVEFSLDCIPPVI